MTAQGLISEIERLREALLQQGIKWARLMNDAEEKRDWQPMETAPKDGTWILATVASDGWIGRSRWLANWGGRLDRWDNELLDDRLQPTHWQPLPEPPKEDK